MKKNMKRFAQLMGMGAVCTVAFTVSFPSGKQALRAPSAISALKSLKPTWLQSVSADSGEGSIGSLFRMMAFMIVGFPDDATYAEFVTGGDGPPQNGMIGMVNDIMGADGLGQIFSGKYSACADLPSTGSDSATTAEGTLTVTYSTPDTAIPSRYTDAGGNYQKKLSLAFDGTTVFTYEFDCNTPRGIATFSFPESATATRKIKLVFESINSGVKADFGMYYSGTDDERFALRLDGDSTGAFEIHFARVASDAGQYSAFRAAGKGTAGDKMTGYFHMMDSLGATVSGVTDSTSTFTDADGVTDLAAGHDKDLLFCYDFAAKTASVGACSGLALSAPNPTAAYPSSGGFTMANLASASFISSF